MNPPFYGLSLKWMINKNEIWLYIKSVKEIQSFHHEAQNQLGYSAVISGLIYCK